MTAADTTHEAEGTAQRTRTRRRGGRGRRAAAAEPAAPETEPAPPAEGEDDAPARPKPRRTRRRPAARAADAAADDAADTATEAATEQPPARRRRTTRTPRRAAADAPAQTPVEPAPQAAAEPAAPPPARRAAAPEPARRASAPAPAPAPARRAAPRADDDGFGAGVADDERAVELRSADDTESAHEGEGGAADAPARRRGRRGRRGGRGRRRNGGEPAGATDGREPREAGREPREAAREPEPRARADEPRRGRDARDSGRRETAHRDDDDAHDDARDLGPHERRRASTRAAADDDHPQRAPERRAPRAAPEPQRERRREAPSRRDPHRPGALRHVDDFFDAERLEDCQRAIGYHFRDIRFLENALTHSSVKSAERPSYERIEFLGDSVVGLVVSEYLYNRLPDCDEGELTKVKSDVVSTDGLALAARRLGLEHFLAVGRGIQMKDGPPKSLIADVFEAVVGGVYLDRGYEAVRLYILDILHPFIEEALSDRSAKNFKSVLQQVAQREYGETPRYEVLRRSGPDHARTYEVLAVVGGRRFRPARGETKKDAEQAAAKRALQEILREKSRRPAPRRRRPRR